ncbi:MAG TPA: hypothetical protein VE967_11785 [Gemmatimonadaceae bacterium]|nr:hypothetical protein [Gemmatimonadaceae bacterium]
MALHSRRHRAALRVLRETPPPGHVLVMCYGNICRSPYLEALLRMSLPNVEVSSAGWVGPGRGVPEHSTAIAGARGIDLSAHRSRLINGDMLDSADVVIVMDRQQSRMLQGIFRFPRERIIIAGDLDPVPDDRAIHDPWGQSRAVFEASFARLDRCAATFTDSVKGVDD